MGRLPAEVRAMTPSETALLVEAWNEARAAESGAVEPMSRERLQELDAKYG